MFKNLFISTAIITTALAGAISFGQHINAKEVEKQAEQKQIAFTQSKDAMLKIGADEALLGNPDAAVTIIEYSSLSCNHCASFHTKTLPKIDEKYIQTGKVNYVMRPFPLNGPAFRGALLLGCVGKDQYHNFAKVLYEMQEKWAFSSSFQADLGKIAQVGGISSNAFDACMSDKEAEAKLLAARKTATNILNIQSTPTLFINGKILEGAGSIEKFEAIIEPLLAELGSPEKPADSQKDEAKDTKKDDK